MELDWSPILNIAITALAAALTAVVAVVLPPLKSWIASRNALTRVLMDSELARKMDEGAINIIRAAEKHLRQRYIDRQVPQEEFSIVETPSEVEVVNEAQPRLEQEFKETLSHFNKTPEAVRDYLLARVGRALEE